MYGILAGQLMMNIRMDIQSTRNNKERRELYENKITKKELMYSSGDSYASGLVGHQCKCMFMFL
jgi:hypothetical protein